MQGNSQERARRMCCRDRPPSRAGAESTGHARHGTSASDRNHGRISLSRLGHGRIRNLVHRVCTAHRAQLGVRAVYLLVPAASGRGRGGGENAGRGSAGAVTSSRRGGAGGSGGGCRRPALRPARLSSLPGDALLRRVRRCLCGESNTTTEAGQHRSKRSSFSAPGDFRRSVLRISSRPGMFGRGT